MRDEYKLTELTAPYYGQLRELAELREDYGFPSDFMKKFFEVFRKNCLFGLKYLFKVERSFTRKEYKEERRRVNEMFSRALFEKLEADEKTEKEEADEAESEPPVSKDMAVVSDREVAEK